MKHREEEELEQPVLALTSNPCLALPSLRVLGLCGVCAQSQLQGHSSIPSPGTHPASGLQGHCPVGAGTLGNRDTWEQGHLPRFQSALGGDQDLIKAGTRPLLAGCAAAVRDLLNEALSFDPSCMKLSTLLVRAVFPSIPSLQK